VTQNPSHIYAVPGTYTVTLTVSNVAGQSSPPRTRTVVVDHAPPVAAFTCDDIVGGGVSCNGAISSNEVSYLWAAPDAQLITNQGTATPTFTFLTSGMFPITLTVENASAPPVTDTFSDTVTVTVPQPPGLPVITVDPIVGGLVTLSATASNSPSGWSWSAPDGDPPIATTSAGTTSTFTTDYDVDGEYTITVFATNGVGPGPTASETVTVNVLTPPVVTGVSESPAPNSGGTVTLLGTATNGPITTWDWSMTGAQSSTGTTTATPTFTFNTTGSKPGTVTATNSDGTSASFPFSIVVIGPTASFTPVNAPLLTVIFTNTSTPATGATYFWEFGDGMTSTAQSPSHPYAVDDSYTVTLTVTVGMLSHVTSQTVVVPP